MTKDRILDRTLAVLSDLVGFDTTSFNSNLELIAYIEKTLDPYASEMRRYGNEQGTKANLLVRIGAPGPHGVVLSGHTDVVPVKGQDWSTEPFALTRIADRLYGRGTCDMKGFIAAALAAAPLFCEARLDRPVYLAFSYDEEIGCCGSPDLVRAIGELEPRPAIVVVGEPTMMGIVGSHKGLARYKVSVTGQEAHSSLPHKGASAIMAAIRLLSTLERIAEDFASRPRSEAFDPPFSTINIGTIAGGTASNILARHCQFELEVRPMPGDEIASILAPFWAEVSLIDAKLRGVAPELGISVEECANTPPLLPETDGLAMTLVRELTGENGSIGAVAYTAEAGQFQTAGLSTVLCGPGSIEQAHKPDEYVDLEQLTRCTDFMLRLVKRLSARPETRRDTDG
jgi:acetylornithine deacetylase